LLEEELCELLVQSPERGLEVLMNRYMAFVCAIVRGKLSEVCGKRDVEECVSDVFYEMYRMRESLDLTKGSLKAYLAVLAKRRAIDVYRKQRKTNNVLTSLDVRDCDVAPSPHNVEEAVADKELSLLLLKEIQELGWPDSQIVIRKYYFGQSTRTIAQALGIKENTVDKKKSRALAKLKQAISHV